MARGDAAVPAADVVEHGADFISRERMLVRKLRDGVAMQEIFDGDLSSFGREGAGRVRQGQNQRVFEKIQDPADFAGDRAGRFVEDDPHLPAREAMLESHLNQQTIFFVEQANNAFQIGWSIGAEQASLLGQLIQCLRVEQQH